MSAQDPGAYYKKLGQFAVELFQNPLSEWTIKRQYNLLVTSVITTLLAFHVLKFLEVSLGSEGKAAIPSEKAALIILTLLTTYHFVVYLLSVWQDYRILKYKKLLLRLRYDQMSAPELNALTTSQDRAFAIQKELDKLETQISQKLQERRELNDTYNDRINSLMFADLHGGDLPEPGEIETLQQEQVESLRPKDEEIAKLQSKQTRMKAQVETAIDHSKEEGRLNDVEAVVESNAKLERYRLWVEIVFPLAFSLFSIVVSVRSVIRNS